MRLPWTANASQILHSTAQHTRGWHAPFVCDGIAGSAWLCSNLIFKLQASVHTSLILICLAPPDSCALHHPAVLSLLATLHIVLPSYCCCRIAAVGLLLAYCL